MLRYLTAGESHGQALMAILEGMPAGLKLHEQEINYELSRRQQGYGRGRRMQIEKDKGTIVCGLRKGLTIGSPIGILIKNKDFRIEKMPGVFCPRPAHADLAGILKYGFKDARDVLERASARETAARVAVGSVAKVLLNEFKINVRSKVMLIGGEVSPEKMRKKIDLAAARKDTVGGIFEVIVSGVPAGLGSYVQQDRRLDARLTQAIVSIPGIKAVGVGLGFGFAYRFGSQVHDAIYPSGKKGFCRRSNNSGGIEGGMSNGEEIILHACMKPIATLLAPLDTVNILTRKPAKASTERSDICAVESAAVVAESACAFVLADCLLEKFGSDSLEDIKQGYRLYLKRIS